MVPWRSVTMLALAAVAVAALAAVLVLGAQPAAADEVELTWVGATPGAAKDVAVAGDYAYIAVTSGLLVVDISEETDPTLTTFLALEGGALAVTLAGDYIYVGNAGGLRVIDISNLEALEVVGYNNTTGRASLWGSMPLGLEVSGDYAYMTVWEDGLRIFDISDPTAPKEVGNYDTPGRARGVAVSGGHAYVAGWSDGLRIINVSDPSAPKEVGYYNTSGYAWGVAVSGEYAYVGDEYRGLRIIDISDPKNPEEVGNYDTPGWARGVSLFADYAYVADSNRGLTIIDVSDPTAPEEVGNYDTRGTALDVTVIGGYAYVADHHKGMRVIDVGDPTGPEEVGYYDTPGSAWDVAISGDYIYMTDWNGGLRIIDVSDPTAPEEVGFYPYMAAPKSVAVSGDYAYVVAGSYGLWVINISDPTNPVEMGTYDTPGTPWGLAVSGDYAYVADGDEGLRVIDISDPTAPEEVGYNDTPDQAQNVVVADDYAYVADGDKGLRIIDISDPTAPVEVGYNDTPGYAWGIAIFGSYAYVADGDDGLRVIDISNPTAPEEVGYFNTFDRAFGVTVSNNYAFVGDEYEGVLVIDINDPTKPEKVGYHDTPGAARNVVVSGDYAYVADWESGLQILGIKFPLSAIIDSIEPNPANEGEIVGFYGRGVYSDGNITGYHWRSSLDDDLSTEPSFNTSSLSIGTHTIFFKVQAEGGNWSKEVSQTLKINSIPTAIIDSIAPSPANQEDEVTFEGHGTDDDGSIAGYQWRSDIAGLLSIAVNFSTTSLSPGTHTISFRVRDNDSAWSEWDTLPLHINALPFADIDSILPSPANEGDEITFNGSGLDSDGTITNYQWRSDLDGNLSNTVNFTTTSLSPGNHNISFRVQDNDDAWSSWVNTTLLVNVRPVLSNGSVTPTTGGESTTFTFAVDYIDPDGGQNYTVQVTLAGLGTFAMADPDGDGTFQYNTTLPWGYRNFSFSATDDYDASATGDTALHELLINDPPLLANGSVTPAIGGESTTFTFSVDYDDLNAGQTGIVQVTIAGLGTFAMADPDGDGLYHYETTLPRGYRNFSFSATDDYDASATGDIAPHELRVNARPTATIDASAPTNATFGEEVTLTGFADDPDGTIAAWEWRSDRDGLLGTTATLTINNLSVGTHNLTFRVRDDSGAWSEPATAPLTVQARPTVGDAAGPLGLAPLVWAALGGVVLLAGGGAGAYFWRRQAPPPTAGAAPPPAPPAAPGTGGAPLAPAAAPAPASPAAAASPAAPLTNIACPGCQAQMAVPRLGRLQSVRCGSCGLAGEIEI